MACAYTSEGLWSVGILTEQRLTPLEIPYNQIAAIGTTGAGRVCIIGSHSHCASELYEFSPQAPGDGQVLSHRSEPVISQASISIGHPVSFPSADGRHAHAFFYAPKHETTEAPRDDAPPLIVMSHGGPTSSTDNGLRLSIQFWTSRGFAVMDVNYGGSSGYGRAYRDALKGRWGIVDVEDCVAAAEFASSQGWVDPQRRAIRGGSAGGYTTLAALAFTDAFQAGASHYGVADLEALARDTHKFESRYLDALIGPYPEEQALYKTRSPLNSAHQIACPVIFFQGLEDRVVPPNQADLMVAALKKNGIPHRHVTYEGEGHGFRKAENIIHSLNAELAFYREVFEIS